MIEGSKRLFDAVRRIAGRPLTRAEVDAINVALNERPATRLRDPAAFFDAIRADPFGGKLTADQVDGINAKLDAFGAAGWPIAWAAYGFGTSFWETGRKMQPVEEIGRGKGRPYGVPGRNGGQIPFGRGDVQLTHDVNYERADRELGLKGALVRDYAMALRPDISARILVGGMEGGWFTGKALADYLPDGTPGSPAQFANARRIINGTDKAAAIAEIADRFQRALAAGGWA